VSTLFSDNFTRADNATVDATNWQENTAGDWSIVSNRVRAIAGTGPMTCLTTASAHAGTTDVKVSATQVSSSGDGGPVARWTAGTSGATSTGYVLDAAPGVCEIYRFDGTATGVLLRTSVQSLVANAILRLEVTGTGATVTLKQFYNDVQKGADASDGSASRIVTAGRTGIHSWATGANGDYDDFLAEDFASAAVTVSVRPQSRPFPFAPGSSGMSGRL
jgi:hypothetical protein